MSEPLHDHDEYQPAKYAEQEEQLRNELHKYANEVLEVAARRQHVTMRRRQVEGQEEEEEEEEEWEVEARPSLTDD